MIAKRFVVKNKVGLHARPAAEFVQTVNKFKSEVKIKKGEKEANAKSIVEVLSLGVEKNNEIEVIVSGEDENQALKAIEHLINSNFGEKE